MNKVVLEVSWRYETPAVYIWTGELVCFSGVEQKGQRGSKQTVKLLGLVKGERENVCGNERG